MITWTAELATSYVVDVKPFPLQVNTACTMQSTNNAQIERSKQPADLKALVIKLRDEKLLQYAGQTTISKSSATFKVDRHTDLQAYMKQHFAVSTKAAF
jgi:hypothetical protein